MKAMKKLLFSFIMAIAIAMVIPGAVPMVTSTVEVQAAASVGTPKLVSLKAVGKQKATLTWKKVSGVKGYKVLRSTNGKSWTTIKTINGASNVTFTDSGLTTGKKYYYTVRAFKNVSGKNVLSGYNKTGLNVIAGINYLKLNKTSINGSVGDTCTLKLTGTSLKPTWKTSNKSVAVVTSNGKVTLKKAGNAVISATLGGKTFKCNVKVKSTYINVSTSTIEVKVGQTKYFGINSSYNTLWKYTNNTSIAQVKWEDASDTKYHYYLSVKGLKAGETTIEISNKENNPTEVKIIKVVVKGSSSSTILNNRQLLKNKILSSSSINSDGNRFIKLTQTKNGSVYTWAVVYDRAVDKFNFIMSTEMSGGSNAAMSMELSVSANTDTEAEYVWISSSQTAAFEARGTVDVSAYSKNSDVYFYITNSAGLSSSSYSTARELANEGLKLAFAGWDLLLQNKTGYSMYDIGFVSYR